MKFKKFTITDECIGCMACVGISDKNFQMNDENKAVVVKQPESKEEEELCVEAAESCPVEAIKEVKEENKNIAPVFGKSNVKEILDKYPELKDVLLKLSPKFKRIQNPVMYNTLARFATFIDAAKVTGVSICEILHTINSYLGVEEKLVNSMPECIKEKKDEMETKYGEEISWQESKELYILNDNTYDDIVEKLSKLKPQHNIIIISADMPEVIIKVIEGLGYKYNLTKSHEYRLSVFNPAQPEVEDWTEKKDYFDILDVRMMTTDPFDVIMQKAYDLEEGDGFIVIQRFQPYPIINMLLEMGFEAQMEQVAPDEVWVYFYKKPTTSEDNEENKFDKERPEVVIQSATPVAYPVIMRLLQSEELRKNVRIKQLKVWEETEKHLSWVVNKKADISFSAVITSLKLLKNDVIFPAVFVWDNFVMLTRGYKAESFKDVIDHEIHAPLFADAPPAKITKYIIKASGLNPDDFTFKFGEPFGRPEEIYKGFVTGKYDTVILREPEASYAIKILEDQGVEYSEISFNEVWNKYNPGFGSFPNAGIMFKGEFVREHPEAAKLVMSELEKAIKWVNEHKEDAAMLSFDMMRQPVDRVERFLERVNFNYVTGEPLLKKLKAYFEVLVKEDIIQLEDIDSIMGMFKL
jgi:NitT/TauT family transport system substrate-binding protein